MPTSYESLSLRDLLDAREAYHWHLLSKQNVVATAVGRYLIRNEEPWPSSEEPSETAAQRTKPRPRKEKRTLQNSSVRPYSWPCVIVFVKSWVDQEQFGGKGGAYDPNEMVPRTLYLSDGRMVPVCVVEARIADAPLARTREWNWPASMIGGGFPIEVDVQGIPRIASVGCLVSDGHLTYAVTSRHVAGEAGTIIYSRLRGQRVPIGTTSVKQITRVPLTALYEGFSGAQTSVNLDVGLIAVDNANDWTAQIYGVPQIGPLLDLSTRTLSLRLIDRQVRAFGAASGEMFGRIKAFFYRYQSLAGIDHVSDFLIEPSGYIPVSSRPGDSGTLWLLVDDQGLPPRPMAVQWGGHVFSTAGGDGRFAFALATGLSNVCSRLGVDLVSSWNTGLAPYWGKVGHYSIATFAVDLLSDPKLRALMRANLDRISFEADLLNANAINDALRDADFIPLADVPDIAWKMHPQFSRGSSENPTHYADIDEPVEAGKTLLELCLEDPANIDVEIWRAHYTASGHTAARERGLLPFRIRQFYSEMVRFVSKGKVADFVCAAGILSHYVGDACQTLHSSYLNDGYKDRPLASGWEGKDVHSVYETFMIDRHSQELLDLIGNVVRNSAKATPGIADGQAAAVEAFNLMHRAHTRIPPADLCDSYIAAGGKKTVAVANALWSQWNEETAEAMYDGAMTLARLWESAWEAGNGDAIAQSKIKAVPFETLVEKYGDRNFVRSLVLDKIGRALS